jgi:uncharacterized protein (TIGR02271 family)
MTSRTVMAMFNTRDAAERAAERLVQEIGLDRTRVELRPEAGATDAGYDTARPYEETGFFASLRNLFVPDEDRYSYTEGMRRGAVLLSARVDETQAERAAAILEQSGAMDLDAEEASWRQAGWQGYDAETARTAAAPTATSAVTGTATSGTATTRSTTAAGQEEAIPLVEERLHVGKREVNRGRVRVRTYVHEVPVEELVRLRDEHVHVERRPADRRLTGAEAADAFRERTIEVTETDEEPVVSKEAVVREEVVVGKTAEEREQAVRDTVRRTEVDVEGDPNTTRDGVRGGASGGTGTGATKRK